VQEKTHHLHHLSIEDHTINKQMLEKPQKQQILS